MKEEQNPYRAHLYRRNKTNEKQNTKMTKKVAQHVVVYLALLTGPLRIQLWSQEEGVTPKQIGNEHGRKKPNKIRQTSREESRQKGAGVKVACKGHRRQEGIQEGENQEAKAN